ncbi:MAG: prolipoprotein diacylglyceryl transferase [Defluviitaleaceae bacterium]|nr:prolipoprotein diacylglyceryl transferase [Defluviitaleaceae bacterium]
MPPDNITPDIWFPNLRVYFENVPRVLFSPFGFDIYIYAVLIVFGIILAYYLAIWWVKKSGQKVEDYNDLLLLGLPLALIGLRTYYLAFNWDNYSGQNFFRVFFQIRDGGLAIYGGIISSAIAAAIISMRRNIPFSLMADTAAPSMLLGQVIGRFGNFFNREAFGGYTDNIFAMRIRVDQARGSATITDEMWENVVYIHGAEYFQVHPTFLYEAAFNLLLMLALILYRPHRKFDGEIVLLYFLGYGIIRFFVEGLRTDQMMFLNTSLPLNQLMAVLFAVISTALIIAGHMRVRDSAKFRRKR